MNINSDTDQLDQQMLELVYELVADNEAAQLRERIAREPAAAEAYQRALRTARVFSTAARWQESPVTPETLHAAVARSDALGVSIGNGECVPSRASASNEMVNGALRQDVLSGPEGGRAHSAFRIRHSAFTDVPAAPLRRALQCAVGIAATVLFAFLLGAYLHHRGRLSEVAARHIRVTVSGPSQLALGAENEFEISTTDMLGEPQSVPLHYTLFDLAGKRLLTENGTTDLNGFFALKVPGDEVFRSAAFPRAVRLEVLAMHHDQAYRMETAVPLSPYRFLTRLSTDKPLYRPGEIVHYRSLTLGRFGLDTPAELPVAFEIHDPAGGVVAGSEYQGVTERGVGNGACQIPADRSGGKYELIARSPSAAFPEEKRSFFVRDYRTPELKKELEFIRDSYTPGDRVAADLALQKAKGGAAAGAQLTITARVDGQVVHQATDKASDQGRFRVEFELPKEIERGEAQLAVQCDDGGVRETIAKTIPINLGKVEVYLCPEGGDLVAGCENRVYFRATSPLGKPVHVEGSVVNEAGGEVCQIETIYKGMGRFAFTPAKDETYHVRLKKPAGVKTETTLPAVAENRRMVLSTGDGVFEAGEPIAATLRSTKADVPLMIAAYCRGVQVGQEMVTVEAGMNSLKVPVAPEASGVIRLTVYDYSRADDHLAIAGATTNAAADDVAQATTDAPGHGPRAIAERLVYRKPDRRLQIRVADHAEKYAPGDKVALSLLAVKETGEPAKSAVLGCAVVDDSLLKLADDDSPAMATHYYLTSEVEKPEDLEKADFYLSDDPKADLALDLLLGTQGWRRFVEQKLDELQQKSKEVGQPVKPSPPVERLVALGGAALPPTLLDNLDEVREEYDAERAGAEADYRAAAGQLSRAALYGGLVLAGLLIAMSIAPYLGRWRQWSWGAMAQRFGPALAAAGLCTVVGLLWNPVAWELPKSNLVALEEFKLQPVTLPKPAGKVSQAQGMKRGLAASDWTRGGSVKWYWDVDAWGDMNRGKQGDQYYNFAYTDLYGFDHGYQVLHHNAIVDALKLVDMENLNRLYDTPVLYPTPEMWMDLTQTRGRFKQADLDDLIRFDPLAYNDRRAYLAGGEAAFLLGSKLRAEDYDTDQFDAYVKLLKQQIEQFRFPVREYAHQHVASADGVRSDFAETLYWHPLLVTDENGRANIEFDLADAVTSYRVLAEAHDGAGRIGTGDGELIARLPFTVEPKMPLEVNAGDRIELPVAVSNDSAMALETMLGCEITDKKESATSEQDGAPSAPATLPLLKLAGAAEQRLAVAAVDRARAYFAVDVVGQKGTAEVEVRGKADGHSDAKRQSVRVVPPGFPVARSYAGRIEGQQEVSVDLPESVIPGTLEVTLAAYPSTIASIQSGLDGILREPSGCFEQASSSNYPNLLLLQYLEENKISRPEIARRGKELLSAGYAKLAGYECKNGGFEWFGADPGHEALTAYGLLEFRDMAKVYTVDPALLDRTATWLLSRRDGNGGFQHSTKKLDGFGAAPESITNAYIVWALAESGQQGIDNELAHVINHARSSSDAYEIALACAAAVACGRPDNGRELAGKLVGLQDTEGRLVGQNGSITRSGGQALAIETTALASLAWLKLPEYHAHANRAIDWIVSKRSGDGSFGSTQATILALKALAEHAKINRGKLTAGELVVQLDDRVLASQQFNADEVNTIRLTGFESDLKTGQNELALILTGENQMPYTIDVSYRAHEPQSDPDCPVELTTKLASKQVSAGETVALEAELVNKTNQGQPMTVAILGLPAGLQPRADQLEELKKAGTIDYYETRAREVICYWRSLAPNKRVPLKLDLVAQWPGKYTGPASRAYLYYTAEQKHWAAPLAIEIAK